MSFVAAVAILIVAVSVPAATATAASAVAPAGWDHERMLEAFSQVEVATIDYDLQDDNGSLRKDGHQRRELSTRCTVNGRHTAIGDTCCRQIVAVQDKKRTSPYQQELQPTCQQLDVKSMTSNLTKYCTIDLDESTNDDQVINCVYDVKQENPTCAKQITSECATNGGKVFTSDVAMECSDPTDGLTMIITVQDELLCLGSACTHYDLQEYLWTGAFTSGVDDGKCKVVQINEQSLKAKRRQDTINGVIGGSVGIVLIGLYIYFRFVRRCQRRHSVTTTFPPSANRNPSGSAKSGGDSTSFSTSGTFT